jgi:hypothetical protein
MKRSGIDERQVTNDYSGVSIPRIARSCGGSHRELPLMTNGPNVVSVTYDDRLDEDPAFIAYASAART